MFSVYYTNHNNILIKMLSEKLLATGQQLRSTFVVTNCLFNNFLDINECTKLSSLCHQNANCINANGSYSCQCLTGYSGDGKVDCTGIVLLCNYFIIVFPSLIFKMITAWEGQCMIFYLCMILNNKHIFNTVSCLLHKSH